MRSRYEAADDFVNPISSPTNINTKFVCVFCVCYSFTLEWLDDFNWHRCGMNIPEYLEYHIPK